MLCVNFNAYASYVTDSLYQWDVNQDLVINGLGLSVAPEIHFANADMDRAIVRQSTLESGVVTVRIPNSLLQSALTIKAYVGIYEGETFKVIETIEIPVIAKTKPEDYTIEDSDEEIYSFKALENEIVNAKMEIAEKCDANLVELTATVEKAKTDIEAQLQETTENLSDQVANAKTDLENEVNDTTNVLSAQLANIIAHNNDTEGNSELIDIRVDVDGKTHTSAGDAVRYQVGNLKEKLEDIAELTIISDNKFDGIFDESGYFDSTGDVVSENCKRSSQFYAIDKNSSTLYIAVSEITNTFVICLYDADKNFINNVSCSSVLSNTVEIYTHAVYFKVYAHASFNGSAYVSTIKPSDPVDFSYVVQNIVKPALLVPVIREETKIIEEKVDELVDSFEEIITGNSFDNVYDTDGYITSSGIVEANVFKCTSKYYALPNDQVGGKLYVELSKTTKNFVVCVYDHTKSTFNTFNCGADLETIIELGDKVAYYRIYTNAEYDGSAYVSTIKPSDPVDYSYSFETRAKNLPLLGKTVVNFGDSIFGMFRGDSGRDESISSFISKKTGATCINVGFGGTRMAEHEPYWDAFSMHSLADSIYTGDWTLQDTALPVLSFPDYFSDHLQKLKAIIWENVDIITIAYGTNDYTGGVTLEAYANALKYSVEKILTKYNHIKVVVVTPTYRWFYLNGSYSHDCNDSQSANDNGNKLSEFVDTAIDTSKELHIQCIDNFYGIGMNRFNYLNYFDSTDGTHPKRNGRMLLGYNIADSLLRY